MILPRVQRERNRFILILIGVCARDGQRPWCPIAGHGRVKEHKGHYHDGVHAKGNEIVLALQDEFGGMAPGGVALMHRLAERVGEDSPREDGTAYVDGDWAAATFAAHWGMKLSLAVVVANARRALRHLDKLRGEARRVVAGRAVVRGRRVRVVPAEA